jgi:hypothetical protein
MGLDRRKSAKSQLRDKALARQRNRGTGHHSFATQNRPGMLLVAFPAVTRQGKEHGVYLRLENAKRQTSSQAEKQSAAGFRRRRRSWSSCNRRDVKLPHRALAVVAIQSAKMRAAGSAHLNNNGRHNLHTRISLNGSQVARQGAGAEPT